MKLNNDITIDFILQNSRDHSLGGKKCRIETDKLIISIVGGRSGFYGDFINTFEVAVLDTKSGSFITPMFFNGHYDEVAEYVTKEELLEVLNVLIKKGSQIT
jgi:hypothetical protein